MFKGLAARANGSGGLGSILLQLRLIYEKRGGEERERENNNRRPVQKIAEHKMGSVFLLGRDIMLM